MTLVDLIARKRDGAELAPAELRRFVDAFNEGELADYQMAAFLMAVYLRGMTPPETAALTDAMLHSGEVVDLGAVPGVKVDKHSTGGVGDKVSLCLAPLVAACGVPVPMVSGRGLGHTGGTLDKLEAIAGFRTALTTREFVAQLASVGVAMIGQTAEIAPADKRMYALRDVTATVESLPLIVASILSKKLASGVDALVFDVKVGRGAFMKREADARALARALVDVGTAAGKRVVALLTDMNTPLGVAIGNALETREAIEVLHGRGPADLVECTLALGAEMLVLGRRAADTGEARRALADAITSGGAAETMRRMIAAQGGDPRVVDEPSRLGAAAHVETLGAPRAGFVAAIDPLALGLAALDLGAGRTRADQDVAHEVGLEVLAKRGRWVAAGAPIARLHARSAADAARVVERVAGAFVIDDNAPSPAPLIIDRIG